MNAYTNLNLRAVKPDEWNRIIDFAASRDVEEGETDEYMYSVRKSTGSLTIWTKKGWRDGYYVARIVVEKKGSKLRLVLEGGTAPGERLWSQDKVESHLQELHSRLSPEEKPL